MESVVILPFVEILQFKALKFFLGGSAPEEPCWEGGRGGLRAPPDLSATFGYAITRMLATFTFPIGA